MNKMTEWFAKFVRKDEEVKERPAGKLDQVVIGIFKEYGLYDESAGGSEDTKADREVAD